MWQQENVSFAYVTRQQAMNYIIYFGIVFHSPVRQDIEYGLVESFVTVFKKILSY
jgi:hypothetical protein